ncbi:MAG: carboxypeptidase-like regulatory domain-containing protein [Patescibacteria group bacterium]|nr:carboxypeptidase-like regulatory domain-containing protein [Patescibacteria group bacterium]
MQSSRETQPITRAGLSLIDVIVGVSLMVLVFVSIFGVFRLSTEVIANSKARIGALALVNEQAEYIRSLSYDDVGTVAGIPSGNIPQIETITLNDVEYIRRILVQYVDEIKDGEGAADENGITADYKRAKIEVKWTIRQQEKSIILVTNVVPKGIESLAGGGTLIINVFDALGAVVEGANVHIENNSLIPAVSVDISTNSDGKVLFPGSPSGNNYEITVTKTGYSNAQTYDADAGNPNPNPGHLSVIAGETTSVSFQIDKVSGKTVRTFTPVGDDSWEDLFADSSKISQSASTTVSGGALVLSDFGSGFEPEGFAYSEDVSPQYLTSWQNVSWNDVVSASTSVLYRLYYYNAVPELVLIPDIDLPGNVAGFISSPVDLSALNIANYDTLRVAAFLDSIDASSTPSVLDWSIAYAAGPIPLPDIPFHMRGTKTIGTDGGGLPIYKYEADLQTDGNGITTINDLEWDNYDITVNNAGLGLDISEACPSQPRSLNPDTTVTSDLVLSPHTNHSFLISVTDISSTPIQGASVRLYRLPFDETQNTSSCGQTFFSGLSQGTVSGDNPYSLTVSMAGYQDIMLSEVDVDGASKISIVLQP